MSVAAIPITAFSVTPAIDRAISHEAEVLRKLISTVSEFAGSVTVGERKRLAREALEAAYIAKAQDPDEASIRVEPSTYAYADQFLGLLPEGVSPPDITVDTDGEIMMEWDKGRRSIFSVSIGRDGTLNFAGLFGHSKIHGTEPIRDALPSAVSDCLQRLSAPTGF
jgi:hypothetical protein